MIEIHEHNKIKEIRLNRPPVNALNPALLQALHEHMSAVHREPDMHSAVIVSGQPGMFTAGLDLPELLRYTRAQMQDFWRTFYDLWRLLATCPVPVVAAITGHSPAGGTVLSVFCDYRIMAEGEFKIGLNETQVGLVAPSAIFIALQRLLGARAAERHLVSGQLLGPAQALSVGLVDEVVAPDQVMARAIAWCEQLGKLPKIAMLGNRRMAREELYQLFSDADDGSGFLDIWFMESTQQALQQVIARLKQRV